MLIDPEFFGYLAEHKDARHKDNKVQFARDCKQILSKYPELETALADVQEIDQIYEQIDYILRVMFDSMTDRRFKAILDEITRGIKI